MLEITTAERIIDTEIERQVGRRAAREAPVMRTIYQAFLARGGPVPVEDVMAAVPDMSRDAVASRLAALDEDDLIQIVDGKVETAYPFTARPTPFVVRPATGGATLKPAGNFRRIVKGPGSLGLPSMTASIAPRAIVRLTRPRAQA